MPNAQAAAFLKRGEIASSREFIWMYGPATEIRTEDSLVGDNRPGA
jgi:hypothetical protein